MKESRFAPAALLAATLVFSVRDSAAAKPVLRVGYITGAPATAAAPERARLVTTARSMPAPADSRRPGRADLCRLLAALLVVGDARVAEPELHDAPVVRAVEVVAVHVDPPLDHDGGVLALLGVGRPVLDGQDVRVTRPEVRELARPLVRQRRLRLGRDALRERP